MLEVLGYMSLLCLFGAFPLGLIADYLRSKFSGKIRLQKLKGIRTPSVKRQQQRQGPIGIHCAAPKSVPDPYPSGNLNGKT